MWRKFPPNKVFQWSTQIFRLQKICCLYWSQTLFFSCNYLRLSFSLVFRFSSWGFGFPPSRMGIFCSVFVFYKPSFRGLLFSSLLRFRFLFSFFFSFVFIISPTSPFHRDPVRDFAFRRPVSISSDFRLILGFFLVFFLQNWDLSLVTESCGIFVRCRFHGSAPRAPRNQTA